MPISKDARTRHPQNSKECVWNSHLLPNGKEDVTSGVLESNRTLPGSGVVTTEIILSLFFPHYSFNGLLIPLISMLS